MHHVPAATLIRLLPAVLLCFVVVQTTAAQVNTERLRSRTDGTTLALDGSVAIRSGNSDLLDVASSVRIDHRDARNYVFWLARLSYGTNNNTTYSNSAFTHLRLNRDLSAIWIIEAFGQLERDGFTLLQLRSLLGAGLRLRYTDSPTFRIYQGSALMYENERLDSEKVVVHPDRTSTLRWSNYVSISGNPTKSLSLVSTTYVQPALSDFGDARIVNDSSIEVQISEALSLTTTLTVRYDSKPPDNIESTDVIVRNGLKVRLGP